MKIFIHRKMVETNYKKQNLTENTTESRYAKTAFFRFLIAISLLGKSKAQ